MGYIQGADHLFRVGKQGIWVMKNKKAWEGEAQMWQRLKVKVTGYIDILCLRQWAAVIVPV